MANRWVVSSGSWNSTSRWSTTKGGASGASVPTVSDDVYFPDNASYTVDLNVNASARTVYFDRGTLSLNGYTLTIHNGTSVSGAVGFIGAAGQNRTLNMMGGSIYIKGAPSTVSIFALYPGGGTVSVTGDGSILLDIGPNDGGIYPGGIYAPSCELPTVWLRFNGLSSSVRADIAGSGMSISRLFISSDNNKSHQVSIVNDVVVKNAFVSNGAVPASGKSINFLSNSNKVKFSKWTASNGAYTDILNQVVDATTGVAPTQMTPYIGATSTGHASWINTGASDPRDWKDNFAGTTMDSNKWVYELSGGSATVVQNDGLTIESYVNSDTTRVTSRDTYNMHLGTKFTIDIAYAQSNQGSLIQLSDLVYLSFMDASGEAILSYNGTTIGDIYDGGKLELWVNQMAATLYISLDGNTQSFPLNQIHLLSLMASRPTFLTQYSAGRTVLALNSVGIESNLGGNFLPFFNGA